MSNRINYLSTRGEEISYSLEDAILRGLAPDGGLFLPDHVPSIRREDVTCDSFSELASNVLRKWLPDEISDRQIKILCEDAFSFDVPLVPIETAQGPIHILELFHGPTLSFKDFGARFMARLMRHFLESRDEGVTILVATSGDTGSAVADGFSGQDGIRVVLLYPKGQVSPTQERQLIQRRPGITVCSVDGTFDDCQRMVKSAFSDHALDSLTLSSANSINVGRLLPQMLYYWWADSQFGEPASFCVPGGNLGNLTAGVLAHCSGMPVDGFVAAHNANNFFPSWLEDDQATFSPSVRTISNAMDVGAPSNHERLSNMMSHDALTGLIRADSVSDEETRESMRLVYEETGYIADPHTAVGIRVQRQCRPSVPQIVLSTAHPAKFPEIVEPVLGIELEIPARLSESQNHSSEFENIAPTSTALNDILLA